jgi:Tfp pilus assembly protein PilF
MALIRYRSIDEIKETLQNAKSRGRGCALLIGAGCSVKAGIPAAAGFVDIMKDKYKLAYQRASAKTYPKCMGELLLSERRDLIAQYVDKAQINWAHLCIALLMQAGYVDRVLTTNFDLLVARACAMLGVFPATYDFATSQLLKKADIPDQAVFYLHGQRTGFVLMNTEEDMKKHSELLGPVFEDAGSGRVWIVVGYSGENDPVFNHLANIPRFDNGLFWIGYGDQEPASHVREQLLTQDKDAFFTKGFDADSFFVSLTRALEIFPPDVVARPFTYLQRTLTYITPFTDPGQTFEDDVMRTPRDWILSAIEQFETPAWEIIRGDTSQMEGRKRPALLTVAARYLLMQGHYKQVLAFRKDYNESPSAELADVLSMAYVMEGNQLLDRAKATTGEEADRLFTEAREMYEAALAIKSDRHEALHNWGNLLLDLAKTKTGQEADMLFAEAKKKYEAAIAIKPDRHEVLINWGNLLLERAKTKTGGEAEQLFIAAEEKYKAALAIKPGMPEILLNWGNLLLDRAKTRTGEESDQLFTTAEEKYKAALAIKADMPDAFYQWGNVLLDRAKTSSGGESDRLFTAAEEKYRAALAIKPDMYEALNNWGSLLLDQGKRKSGKDADERFIQAREKYKAALAIKPDMFEAFNNWGNLLLDWRKTKTGQEADELFDQAEEKYGAALAIKPDMYDALDNWGNLLLDQAKTKTEQEADQLFDQAEEKFRAALAIKPDRYEVFNNWGNVLSDRARRKTGQDADLLFVEAEKKYTAALAIKPGAPDVLHNWGNLLQDRGKTKTGQEAAQLLAQAEQKFQASRTIQLKTN